MNPKVSICAVAHKVDDDLKSFIKQVYDKTKNPFELIITDNSEDCVVTSFIMKEGGEKTTVISTHMNLGLGWGMNKAFRRAKGEYILRCDVDIDINTEHWDEWFIRYLEKYPELDLPRPDPKP